MMAVGDRDRLPRRGLDQRRDRAGLRPVLRHGPQAVPDAVVVGDVYVRAHRGDRGQRRGAPTAGICEETDDRAGIHHHRSQELVTVFLRPG